MGRIDEQALEDAARVVREGGLIVLPTDTVYGVACDPCNPAAISLLYQAKQRPASKALQVILASTNNLTRLGLYLPEPLDRLAAAFLPGPFSPIAAASPDSPLSTLRNEKDGSRTQAIRLPDSDLSLRILQFTGPLAASSANRSGGQSPQTVQEAYEALGDAVDLYLDGGPTQGHMASTVVAASPEASDGISILRQGIISRAAIRQVLQSADGGVAA
ncbi:threonylcarbamoyl-AMP synthase [Bifidobacterium aemilianum]|uniref:L-threonylcarbamoyladenylate synthase n=1 Tax=Bifidobacterium aemilianum TaxID=2493120 RepID=A0A366K6N5_9BIFI|nr:threonylcarbamoyl-AMP synthase [Bifidobacterium aemilianum]